jgi:cytochrome P450
MGANAMTDTMFRFDPRSPEFNSEPNPTYAYLREHAPLHYWPGGRGYLVSRHTDVLIVLRDPRFATSPRQAGSAAPPPRTDGERVHRELMAHDFFSLASADHIRIRRLASPVFTGTSIARKRDAIQQIVDEELDELVAGQPVDLAKGPSVRIPLRVLRRVLGVSPADERLFLDFADAMIRAFEPGLSEAEFDDTVRILPDGQAMLSELIAARRRQPGDDLLSDLIQAEQEGTRLTTAELVAMMSSLITAGVGSITQAICHTVWNLLRHRDQYELLRAEPGLLPDAINEVSRFGGFVKMITPRRALADVELSGGTVRAGEKVIPMPASAMRDPAAFPEPDRLDIRREPTNLWFGAGAHFCLGSPLARVELELTLGTLFRRFPGLQQAGDAVFEPTVMIRKMIGLPVRLPGRPA